MILADIAFFVLAALALAAAVMLVISRALLHGALWLSVLALASAGLFMLVAGDFAAVAALLVTALAVPGMVAALALRLDPLARVVPAGMSRLVTTIALGFVLSAATLAVVLLPVTGARLGDAPEPLAQPQTDAPAQAPAQPTTELTAFLFSDFGFGTLVTALALVAGLVGAAMLAQRRIIQKRRWKDWVELMRPMLGPELEERR
ncbi:MAG: NADH-quinone oxidoreductase subunit J [Pseudomonadota bacterium]